MDKNVKVNVKFSSKLHELDASKFATSKDKADYIGCGTYGAVRLCFHEEFGEVAAKCFMLTGSQETVKKRINEVKREADVLVRLSHPNIIKIIGFSKWGESNFAIVLEFGCCGNLYEFLFLKKVSEISWQLRKKLVRQLASGLAYLHYHDVTRQFFHGDIKPENLLLDRDLNLKMTDFGSVNIKQITQKSTTLCVKPSTQITVKYAAPEVLNGEPNSTCADMYSVSMVIYEIVTRSKVFVGVHPGILTYQISNGKKPHMDLVEKVRSSLSKDLDESICSQLVTIMEKCWDNDPTKRPTSRQVEKELSTGATFNVSKEVKEISARIRKPTKNVKRKSNLSCFSGSFMESSLQATETSDVKRDELSSSGLTEPGTSGTNSNSQQQETNSSEAGPSHNHGNDSNPGTVESIYGNFRKCLDDQNHKILGRQKNIPVPLDVSKETKLTSEEFGDENLNLAELHKNRSSLIGISQMFPTAKADAEERAKSECINQAAIEVYIIKHGNVVGMIGPAGIGKSTCGLQVMVYLMENLPKTDRAYVFHISLRSFDKNQKISLLQFLTKSYRNWKHDQSSDQVILGLLMESNYVFIIIDGLDEAGFENLSSRVHVMDLNEKATPEVILKNLLSGEILPNARKLLISRPGPYHELHPDYKPHLTVVVIGLSENSQHMLFEQKCKAEDLSAIEQALDNNPSAKALCFIPIYHSLIVAYITKHGKTSISFSVTEIFTSYLEDIVHDPNFLAQQNPEEVLPKLARLAFDGMFNDNLQFKVSHLKEYGLIAIGLEVFFGIVVCSVDINRQVTRNDILLFFNHLLWQEFFASLKLMFVSDFETFSNFLPKLQSNKWERVQHFLFGFLNSKISKRLMQTFSTSQQDFEKKANLLKAHIGRLLPSKLKTFNEDCFKLFSLAHESRDDSITRSVADALPQEIKISGSPIQPSDVNSFCHVLRSTERQITINVGDFFGSVQFIGDGLKMFLKMVMETSHKIGMLFISYNKLDEDSLVSMATCVHKIEKLILYKCEIGGRKIKVLTDAIARRETPIGWLGICDNKLDEDSLVSIATCVHKIEKLILWECEIGGRKIKVLTDAIARRETPMKVLNVNSNPLGVEGLKFLLQSFHKIDKLVCDDCDFTSAGEKELKRAENLKKSREEQHQAKNV